MFPIASESASFSRRSYGETRDGGARPHHGVDIVAPEGARVVAPFPGRIVGVSTRDEGRSGYSVTLRDDEGVRWHFAHLRETPLVRRGDDVLEGTPLGSVGTSGNATAGHPHLHLQVENRRGVRVDPTRLLEVMAASAHIPVRIDGARVTSTGEDAARAHLPSLRGRVGDASLVAVVAIAAVGIHRWGKRKR